MFNVDAKQLSFTLDNPDHYIKDSSIKLDKTVYARGIHSKDDLTEAVYIVRGAKQPKKITSLFETFAGCQVDNIAKSSRGVFVNVCCKSSPLDNAISEIVMATGGRVWLRSNPDTFVDVSIENPWGKNVVGVVSAILKKNNLKLKDKIKTKKINMHIDVPFDDESSESEIDSQDIDIAKKLLVSGYYDMPRRKGVNQDVLCKELNISKPKLENRMRKITTIGIQKILGIEDFSKEELDETWDFFKSVDKKQKKSK